LARHLIRKLEQHGLLSAEEKQVAITQRRETLIEQTSRRIIQGELCCTRQTALIKRMRENGLDTSEAEILLAHFEQLLEELHACLRTING
jgi:hypothetical protein